MTRVYLAGPISGLTYDDGNDWREAASVKLLKDGITPLSPLRAKAGYLRDAGILEGEYHELNALSSQKGIVTRDRFDCQRADVVLVNLLGAVQRVSIGTVMECAWADAARVPLVVAMESAGNVHDHTMLREVAGFILPTLDEALWVTTAILREDA